jgi:hypothetical protein
MKQHAAIVNSGQTVDQGLFYTKQVDGVGNACGEYPRTAVAWRRVTWLLEHRTALPLSPDDSILSLARRSRRCRRRRRLACGLARDWMGDCQF